MTVKDEVIHIIQERARVSAPIMKQTHLYKDLKLDSITFIEVLLEIEEMYSITFDIMEMESCLRVGQLIELVENKREGRGECDD